MNEDSVDEDKWDSRTNKTDSLQKVDLCVQQKVVYKKSFVVAIIVIRRPSLIFKRILKQVFSLLRKQHYQWINIKQQFIVISLLARVVYRRLKDSNNNRFCVKASVLKIWTHDPYYVPQKYKKKKNIDLSL